MINNEHEAFVPLTGQCLCGALRFQLTAEPQAARVCWCRDCQHLAGNGMANAVVPVEALHFQGRLAQFQKTAASGNTITREVCPECGTHLFAHSSARPHLRVVRIGNLDEPSQVAPSMNIWTQSAPTWAHLNPDLTCIAGQP